MKSAPRFICPLFVVADIARSREFYEGVLQQEVIYDFGENVTFRGNFAIHLKTHYQALIDGKEITNGSNSGELYFEYDEVEELTLRVKASGTIFVHELREQPWRQRVVRFYDPDMHIIEIGESMEYLAFRLFKEGKGIAEISGIIYMPEDAVNAAIEKYKE